MLLFFRYILESASFELFFKFVELPNFDVASDAFTTFKVRAMSFECLQFLLCPYIYYGAWRKIWQDLLTKHGDIVAEYLNIHYDEVSCLLTNLTYFILFLNT